MCTHQFSNNYMRVANSVTLRSGSTVVWDFFSLNVRWLAYGIVRIVGDQPSLYTHEVTIMAMKVLLYTVKTAV